MNASFSWPNGINGATIVSPGVRGADTAGNFFVQAAVHMPTARGRAYDFGLGPVPTGTYILHYNPGGGLVSDTLPTGIVAVGALGHLYYAPSVTGTVDEGAAARWAPRGSRAPC